MALTGAGLLWGTIGIAVRLLQDGGMTSTSIAFWWWGCACLVLLPILGRAGLRSIRLQLRHPARLSAVAFSSLVKVIGIGPSRVASGRLQAVLAAYASPEPTASPSPSSGLGATWASW